MRYLNRLRAILGSGARTIGVSPKLVGTVATGAILSGLRALGVTGLSAEATLAIGTLVMGAVAWALPPGLIAVPDPEPGPASDELLGDDVSRQLSTIDPGAR